MNGHDPAKPKIIKKDSLGILILRSKIDCRKRLCLCCCSPQILLIQAPNFPLPLW